MGEWSEYFEDFPEENSAKYVGDRFDPESAKARAMQEVEGAKAQAALDAEIRAIINKHNKPGTSGS